MKQAKIEIGKEYAYHWYKNAHPSRVLVLEKGLQYRQAKGRGVRVRFMDKGQERTVNARKISSTWTDWKEIKRRNEMRRMLQRQRELEVGKVAIRLQQALDDAGIEIKHMWSSETIRIHLNGAAAARLAEALEKSAKERVA